MPGLIEARRKEPHIAQSKLCIDTDRVQDGPTWTWFANGQMRSEDHYRDGFREGAFRAWHSNGSPRWEGAFARGREHGLWRAFGCDGELRCEGRAEAGRIVGSWQCSASETPPLEGWLGSLADPAPRPPPGR